MLFCTLCSVRMLACFICISNLPVVSVSVFSSHVCFWCFSIKAHTSAAHESMQRCNDLGSMLCGCMLMYRTMDVVLDGGGSLGGRGLGGGNLHDSPLRGTGVHADSSIIVPKVS